MIKKQQKWIALLVVFTFMWLLQVSTMPLAAAGTAEQVSSANSEQGPRFIEEREAAGTMPRKKASCLTSSSASASWPWPPCCSW
jgi:hypothetical protein